MGHKDTESNNDAESTPKMPRSVIVWVGVIAVFAVGVTALINQATPSNVLSHWPEMVAFFLLGIAAESMDVRFRFHGQVEAINLFETVLAPLLFAFTGPVAVIIAAGAQLTSGFVRKNHPVKVVFNASQWALATGCACAVFELFRDGLGITSRNMLGLLLAMVVAGMVNQVALTVVLRLAQRRSVVTVLSSLSKLIVPGWVVGWSLNTLIGGLFVLAYESSPFAVLVFWVPLAVLHAAYKGYAGTESDRMRLAGLHRASHVLTSSNDADSAVAAFLAEVCRSFEADAAELLLVRREGIVVHRIRNADATTYVKENDADGLSGLRAKLVDAGSTSRVSIADSGELSVALRRAGWRDCLMAPLPSDNLMPGVLVVYNQDGLQGFEEGERAVLEALAREAASSFERGKLFAAVVEGRYKLSQIVDSTSDGVLTLTTEGVIRSWNPGWEQITGVSALNAVGRLLTDVIRVLDAEELEANWESWASSAVTIPTEVQVVDALGNTHWLECLYRPEVDEDGIARVLVVVAHDVTDVREIEQLRENVDRLEELEEVQRQKVLQVQDSLQPPVPKSADAEFGVYYLPSDTSAPTGGDYYDWQMLPGGDIHVAVVDVLGSGVEATNDAFSVIHTLRTLVFQGTPVEHLISEADNLLASLNTELVATVICIRYNPKSGRVRLAGGGHPPPLLVQSNGSVEEIAAPGIPVGWPGAGSETLVDIQMHPSDTLILYTDGLIEARRDILAGLKALTKAAVDTRNLPAPELARALVEKSLEGAERRDDSLALVIRHCGSALIDADTGFVHHGIPVSEQVPVVRHQFLSWISQHENTSDVASDLAVLVSELVTNAVRVANSYFEVRGTLITGGIILEVEDDGPGVDVDVISGTVPNLDDESGRGLFIVRSIADEMHIQSTGHGCIVRTFKHLEGSDPLVLDTQNYESERPTH